MDNEEKKFLVIYDVRGIQKYIFRTKRIKEISGASLIVMNKFKEIIDRYLIDNFGKENCQLKWDDESVEFQDFKLKAEIIYFAAGNLLLAFRGTNDEVENMNKALQVEFLKNTYSLALACAKIEVEAGESYDIARKRVKEKLNDVKKRMPEIVMQKAYPFVESDPITGFPKSDISKYLNTKTRAEYLNMPIECALKRIYFEANKQDKKSIDDMFDDSSKRMIAVVHIDGNDMGAMIQNYFSIIKTENNTFAEDVKISRHLSRSINNVFINKVRNVFKKENYKNKSRLVINSGDDITFISTCDIALNLTKEIMDTIGSEALMPESDVEKKLDKNKFSTCAGICFAHAHFPFHLAYKLAEEVCSIAKQRAKSDANLVVTNIINKNGKIYKHAASCLDFHICDASILKSISEIREDRKDLYVRPYFTNDEAKESPCYIDNLIKQLEAFATGGIARSSLKEIRNTYEKDHIYSKILFEKLKSRAAFKKAQDIMDYIPFIEINEKEIAKYYDATTLMDLVNVESEGDNNEISTDN